MLPAPPPRADHHPRRVALRLSLAAALAAPGLLTAGRGVRAAEGGVALGGSGAALPVFDLVGAAWAGADPASASAVHSLPPAQSDAAALADLASGRMDAALAHRPPDAAEAAQGLRAVPYARSPLAVATRLDNPVAGISAAQLAAILEGRLRAWPDGTPVAIVWRRPPEADLRALAAFSPAAARALIRIEATHGAPATATEHELATAIERRPGAIGFVMLGQMLAERRRLRALSLDGVECTPAELALGRYPLGRPLYWVSREDAPPEARALLEFVREARIGRAVLSAHGHLPLGAV